MENTKKRNLYQLIAGILIMFVAINLFIGFCQTFGDIKDAYDDLDHFLYQKLTTVLTIKETILQLVSVISYILLGFFIFKGCRKLICLPLILLIVNELFISTIINTRALSANELFISTIINTRARYNYVPLERTVSFVIPFIVIYLLSMFKLDNKKQNSIGIATIAFFVLYSLIFFILEIVNKRYERETDALINQAFWIVITNVSIALFHLWLVNPQNEPKTNKKATFSHNSPQNVEPAKIIPEQDNIKGEKNIMETNKTSKFTGKFLESLGFDIAIAFLGLLSIGIALPWLICWKQRWVARNTVIDGKTFVFVGQGKTLFVKSLLWFVYTIFTATIFALWIPILMKRWLTENTHVYQD